jgi:hypothetical protein
MGEGGDLRSRFGPCEVNEGVLGRPKDPRVVAAAAPKIARPAAYTYSTLLSLDICDALSSGLSKLQNSYKQGLKSLVAW